MSKKQSNSNKEGKKASENCDYQQKNTIFGR